MSDPRLHPDRQESQVQETAASAVVVEVLRAAAEAGLCPSCGGAAGENWFDRSLCPEPCGAMHTRCVACGFALDGCQFETTDAALQRRPLGDDLEVLRVECDAANARADEAVAALARQTLTNGGGQSYATTLDLADATIKGLTARVAELEQALEAAQILAQGPMRLVLAAYVRDSLSAQSDLGVERALQQWDDFFTAAALRVGQPQEDGE